MCQDDWDTCTELHQYSIDVMRRDDAVIFGASSHINLLLSFCFVPFGQAYAVPGARERLVCVLLSYAKARELFHKHSDVPRELRRPANQLARLG